MHSVLFVTKASATPPIRKAVLLGAVALIFVITMSGAATSRHVAHGSQSIGDTVRDAPLRGGPLGVVMTELISDCEQLTGELKNFPADKIAQSITLDGSQSEALKNAENIANQSAEGVAETCPAAVPAEPSDRLDMIEREIGGIDSAVDLIEPALTAFYGSLSDEQKAQLVLKFADLESTATSSEATGSTGQNINAEAESRSTKSGDDHHHMLSAPAVQAPWNCEHWQAELRDWPGDRVEQTIIVGPRQRAAFYELAAAVQRAADTLADSCPRNQSITPIARLEDLKKMLDAVRKSTAAIRPALTRFTDGLDDGQKSRFKDAI
jgi:hypothetical protein